MQFQPGQSGNPTGRPKERPFRDALMIALKEDEEETTPTRGTKLRAVANRLVKEAISGDVAAAKEIADRVDGKVPQAQIHQGDEDGGPVRVTKIEIVAASVDGENQTPA